MKYSDEANQTEIVRRRISGEPLQYLLGEWEFYGYPFKVGKGVLIPRPETELIVGLVKHYKPQTVLDLCAGTGCIGIALAKEIGCKVIAVEKSPEAIEYLKVNIKLNQVEQQVEIIKGDVLEITLTQPFDCVLINPPYLSKKEMQNLQQEVTHEPETALYGGEDGLDFYRAFFGSWKNRLKKIRLFACEVGDSQAEKVCRLMEKTGLVPVVKKDFNGIDRVVYSIKTPVTNALK
ncbi:MAG: peptide chain release factor N(5)-glutamine methyltransferase [Oscillospiraceae bacterium]|nr:peptide chain release factor N(5)-glutamine methyltransferase [Oscillospiraceae bacterium]